MREITGKLKVPPFHEVEDEELERIWNSPHSRLVRNSGLVMMVGGYLTLILFALYEFFMSNDDEVLPKFAVAAMIIGFGITLGAVILARLKSYKHDKYTEVER
ncbi:hypothetical protein [Pontiella desulfatans]|nr:hypothetical protein [Pontiella desulfatans]